MNRSRHARRGIEPAQLILILLAALLALAIIGAAVYFGLQTRSLNKKLESMQQQLTDAQQQLSDAQQQVQDLQQQLADKENNSSGNSGNSGNSGSSGNDGGDVPAWKPETPGTDAPSYQLLYPDFYAPQAWNATTAADKTMYLTFDDGPTERTDEILDILKQEGIKATFFVVHYDNSSASHARMRRIVDEGHTLAFHAYVHEYKKIYASVESYLEDAYKIFSEIKEATGYTPSLFRCPGGSRNNHNKAVADEILEEMKRRGFVCYDWNMSVEDSGVNSKEDNADVLVSYLMDQVGSRSRGIILMHDASARKATVKALPMIIEQLRNKGYSFAPLTPDVKPVLFSKR